MGANSVRKISSVIVIFTTYSSNFVRGTFLERQSKLPEFLNVLNFFRNIDIHVAPVHVNHAKCKNKVPFFQYPHQKSHLINRAAVVLRASYRNVSTVASVSSWQAALDILFTFGSNMLVACYYQTWTGCLRLLVIFWGHWYRLITVRNRNGFLNCRQRESIWFLLHLGDTFFTEFTDASMPSQTILAWVSTGFRHIMPTITTDKL